MWRDSESDRDFLNFTEVADQIATMATSAQLLPISIGVFGTWGTGKSTVLRLVESNLSASKTPPIIIKFDAWLYQGFDDAKAALMEVVSARLLSEAEASASLLDKAKRFAKRVNYFRALGLAADFGLGMALGVPPGLLTRAGPAIGAILSGSADADDAQSAKDTAKAVADGWSELVRPEAARTPPKEIEAFRAEFGELLKELKRPVVLFIDNLDRCLPDVAISTLEAIRLFLFIEGTAFVIAADEDMIRHSVSKHFGDPNVKHVHDYLDKVIQVPMRVPQIGVEDLRAYIYSLFVETIAPEKLKSIQEKLLLTLQRGWSGETIKRNEVVELAGNPAGLGEMLAVADRLASILATAPNIFGNPRIVKRLLNAVILRRTLAASRKMNVDLSILAKLAVFERSTDSAATQRLYQIVMDGKDGELLLPSNPDDKKTKELPTEWARFGDFVQQWRHMEPLLDDLPTLRPAIFLSRDVMSPAVGRTGLNAIAESATKALLAVNSITSPQAIKIAASLSQQDSAAVMDTIIAELREADWTKPVAGIHGAIVLAKNSATGPAALKAFVATLQPETMNRATRFLLQHSGLLQKGG